VLKDTEDGWCELLRVKDCLFDRLGKWRDDEVSDDCFGGPDCPLPQRLIKGQNLPRAREGYGGPDIRVGKSFPVPRGGGEGADGPAAVTVTIDAV